MKFLVIFSLTLITLTSADISLHNGHSNNYKTQQQPIYNNAPPQALRAQFDTQLTQQAHAHAQPETHQAPLGSINNPMQITQPSSHYIPAPQQIRQQLRRQLTLSSSNYHAAQHVNVVGVKPRRRYRPRVKVPRKTIVTKSFFIHSAPEESEEELQEELSQLAEQPHKHYNVLFVKAPSQTSKAAAVTLAKTLKDEKTVVYVLSKKTTAAELQDALQDAPKYINKPQVYFIKYRTPEEAEHAQQQIQSQYDVLGGSSTISDEGLAPITSVVGSLDQPDGQEVDEEHLEDSREEQVENSREEEQLSYQQEQEVVKIPEQYPHAVNSLANSQYLPPPVKKV